VQTYSNVTQVYIAVVSSTNGLVKQYYKAGYCAKTKTQPTVCPTSYLQSNDQADWESDVNFTNGVKTRPLSDTDKTLYSDGFFRVFYSVPAIVFDMDTYNVSVYLLNSQETEETDWAAQVADPSTMLIETFTFSVAPSATAADSAAQLSYTTVFGAAAGCFFVSGVGYGAFRLGRYRPKYKAEKIRADENEQILDEMRDEGNVVGTRDYMNIGNANITMNPLHQTFKNEAQLREEFAKARNPALASSHLDTKAGPVSNAQIKDFMEATTI